MPFKALKGLSDGLKVTFQLQGGLRDVSRVARGFWGSSHLHRLPDELQIGFRCFQAAQGVSGLIITFKGL